MVDDDNKTLPDYKIGENGFVVVMQQKVRLAAVNPRTDSPSLLLR